MAKWADLEEEPQIRRLARWTYINSLTSPFDKCGYCGCKIVWPELLDPHSKITSRTQTTVRWKRKGKLFTMALATVEHIHPISKGGGNLPFNLMGSCYPCNNSQTITERKQSPFKKMKDRSKTFNRSNPPSNVITKSKKD